MRKLISRLSDRYDPGEAKAVVRLLLEQAFHLSWTDVLCGAIENLNETERQQLESIMLRLEKGEPVQYVLGEAEFFGRMFNVNKATLIPRIETEILISKVVSSIKKNSYPHILDIGTGTGCIAITLALEISGARVEAWDISEEALDVANANAEKQGAKVLFRNMDALNIPNVVLSQEEKWDVIVSNPPYICDEEKKEMEANVLDYEPHTALFVPDDKPLLFYNAIALYASQTLNPEGILAFEINRNYGKEVQQMMKNLGFTDVLIEKDQFDNDRIVVGKWQ